MQEEGESEPPLTPDGALKREWPELAKMAGGVTYLWKHFCIQSQ